MKKIFILLLIVGSQQILFAQNDTLKRKADAKVADKQATIINPNTSKLATQRTLTPPPQLPDLRITAISVTYKGDKMYDGVMKQVYEVNYTIKNEGTVAIRSGSVGVQGYFSNDPNYPMAVAGCGSGVQLPPNQMLNPGDSGSGFITCTLAFARTPQTVYTLFVDANNYVKEINEQNNKAQVSVL